jgi:hypothetical protein
VDGDGLVLQVDFADELADNRDEGIADLEQIVGRGGKNTFHDADLLTLFVQDPEAQQITSVELIFGQPGSIAFWNFHIQTRDRLGLVDSLDSAELQPHLVLVPMHTLDLARLSGKVKACALGKAIRKVGQRFDFDPAFEAKNADNLTDPDHPLRHISAAASA